MKGVKNLFVVHVIYDYGLVLQEMHRVIEVDQKVCWKEYIDMKRGLRKKANILLVNCTQRGAHKAHKKIQRKFWELNQSSSINIS